MDIINPIFFSLQRNGKILFYLGIRHSYNPKDPQFEFIHQKWDEFVSRAGNPLAVVECNPPKNLETEKEAILKGGEVGLIGFWAKRDGVLVICFEPNRGEEMNYLLSRFSKEQIEYYYFARTVSQWHHLIKKSSVEEYLAPFLERDKKASGWTDFEFSIENIKKVHKKLFDIEMDLNDRKHFEKIENPTKEDNPFKEIVRASGNYRDKAIISGIKNAWEGKDIFITYGRGHAATHQKALENL